MTDEANTDPDQQESSEKKSIGTMVSIGTIGSIASILGVILVFFGDDLLALVRPPSVTEFRVEPLRPLPGDPATLYWHVPRAANVTIEPDIGIVATSGSREIIVDGPMSFTLMAMNKRGKGEAHSLTINPASPPVPSVSISASPNPQYRGERVTLTWSSRHADRVVISDIGEVAPEGSRTVVASSTRSYEIQGSNRWLDGDTESVRVEVRDWPRPEFSIRVEPNPVVRGREATITWNTRYARDVSIEHLGSLPESGRRTLRIDDAMTISGRAQGPGGTTVADTFIDIMPPPPPTLVVRPIDNQSRVQDSRAVREMSNEMLRRLLESKFQLVEAQARPAPDFTSALNVQTEVRRRGLLDEENVYVTVRLTILGTRDRRIIWEGSARSRKAKRDIGRLIGMIAPELRAAESSGSSRSDIQKLELQALAEALEEVVASIPEITAP